MDIYTNDKDFIFDIAYNAKRLLDDSIDRTHRGYQELCQGCILSGSKNFLLARVESVAALSFCAVSLPLTAPNFICTSIELAVHMPLNIISRLPGISSFKSAQNYTRNSSDIIYRTLRIYLKIIPLTALFISAAAGNAVLPGVLNDQSTVFNLIHKIVEPLGPLEKIQAIAPNGYEAFGAKFPLSWLDDLEEYCRALSNKNYINKILVPCIKHHQTLTLYL